MINFGTTTTGEDDGDHNHVNAHFFVHIGDFLSLATMKIDMIPDDNDNGNGDIRISRGQSGLPAIECYVPITQPME